MRTIDGQKLQMIGNRHSHHRGSYEENRFPRDTLALFLMGTKVVNGVIGRTDGYNGQYYTIYIFIIKLEKVILFAYQ